MFHQIDHNDLVLLVSLGYTCVDLHLEWETFSACSKPIHMWLFTSCLCAIGFRFARLLGSLVASSSEELPGGSNHRPIGGRIGECLLDISHKGLLARLVANFTWSVFVPFFALWNVLGTVWLVDVMRETPDCSPSSTHIYFSIGWLCLCHIWLLVHAALGVKAWRMKRRVQQREANMAAVTDADTLERWGTAGLPSNRGSLVDEAAGRGGLSAAVIKALPCSSAPAGGFLDTCNHECSICLTDIQEGERIRRLPRCGHTFHSACIDLWLVRTADCPLCKQSVVEEASTV